MFTGVYRPTSIGSRGRYICVCIIYMNDYRYMSAVPRTVKLGISETTSIPYNAGVYGRACCYFSASSWLPDIKMSSRAIYQKEKGIVSREAVATIYLFVIRMFRMFMVAMATRGNHELAVHRLWTIAQLGTPFPSPTDQMHSPHTHSFTRGVYH